MYGSNTYKEHHTSDGKRHISLLRLLHDDSERHRQSSLSACVRQGCDSKELVQYWLCGAQGLHQQLLQGLQSLL